MKYLGLIAIATTLAAALFVFPNRIPEFAGLWLLWCTYRISRENSIRVELLAIPVLAVDQMA